jgi:hypothetical protein
MYMKAGLVDLKQLEAGLLCAGKRREAGLGRIPNFDPCVGESQMN